MKGQVEKIETRGDNVTKLAITIQPEHEPDNLLKWKFQMVEIQRTESDMVTIRKDEYEALTQGASYLMPNEKRESLKTIASMLLDWCD